MSNEQPEVVLDYKPNETAKAKIEELILKRNEYTEAILKIDSAVDQLRYGISQIVNGKSQCGGYGIAFDLSDYACRELCNRNLQSACGKIVKSKVESKKPLIDIEKNPSARYLGYDISPNVEQK